MFQVHGFVDGKKAAPPKCAHARTVTHYTGDGAAVEFCPDCGSNKLEGK